MQPKYYGAAAEYNQPSAFQPNKKWLAIGGLGILIITVLMVAAGIFSAITSGPSREVATLVARSNDLATLMDDNRERPRNADLVKVNAEATALLMSDVGTFTTFMTSNFGLAEIPADIAAAETDSGAEAELDSAEQIGRFDRAYTDMLQSKIGACLAQAEKVLTLTGDEDFKAALEQGIENLKAVDDQLANLKL